MRDINYKFWAGPHGREVVRRIKGYKRHIVILYCIIGVILATGTTLSTYICNLIMRGH